MPKKRKPGAAKKQPAKKRLKQDIFSGKYGLTFIIAGGALIVIVMHFVFNALIPVLMDPDALQSFEKAIKIPVGKDAIPHIKLNEAYDIFQRGKAVFIDARGGSEYDEAHIKGAISIPAGSTPETIAKFKGVLAGKLLVTYCHGVGCHLSDKTAFALYDAGYRNIKIFFGGWNDWLQAKYPLDKYEPPEQYRHLFNDIALPDAAQEATADEVKFLMDKNLGNLVDVGTQAQYDRMHIVNAYAMPLEILDKSIDQYTYLFKDKPVVLYSHGSLKRTAEAAGKIFAAGGRKILVFPSAIEKWEKAGLPVVNRPNPAPIYKK